jgi:hypothetical protein
MMEKLNEYICFNLANKLYKNKLLWKDIGHMASHICEIENMEIIILRTLYDRCY